VRYQGGANAGHTIVVGEKKVVLHLVPSGMLHEGTHCVIGNGVVLDPIILKNEIEKIRQIHPEGLKNLFISKKAHLILPSHRLLDAASEKSKGVEKIGSTLKGIGPTYMDKTGRNGLRVGDIISSDFREKYEFLKKKHFQLLKLYDFEHNGIPEEKEWFEGIELIKTFKLIDSEYFINDSLNQGRRILAEGAQGTMLDIEFGSYPFVTSSNTISAGACTGLGVAPNKLGKIFGIFKSYCTRVGSGPFPTELFDETGEYIQTKGHEVGATTGRKRRCGWLDMPALKYSIMLNGVTDLIMTKCDILSGMKSFKVAVSYEIEGKETQVMPFMQDTPIKPIYREFKGWEADITNIKTYKALPLELKQYIEFIEKETKLPVTVVSVGPDREETIWRA
jgi:adenylosuccinate synthase